MLLVLLELAVSMEINDTTFEDVGPQLGRADAADGVTDGHVDARRQRLRLLPQHVGLGGEVDVEKHHVQLIHRHVDRVEVVADGRDRLRQLEADLADPVTKHERSADE